MQVRKKTCLGRGKYSGLGCGQDRVIFSNGLCQECASRASYEANKRGLASKPSSAAKSERKYAKSTVWRRKTTGEAEMFRKIWDERPHVSQISGKKLLDHGHRFWYSQFAHIVSKGARPEMRLDPDNIVLMTFEEHFTWDNHRHLLKDKEEWRWLFEKYETKRHFYTH